MQLLKKMLRQEKSLWQVRACRRSNGNGRNYRKQLRLRARQKRRRTNQNEGRISSGAYWRTSGEGKGRSIGPYLLQIHLFISIRFSLLWGCRSQIYCARSGASPNLYFYKSKKECI